MAFGYFQNYNQELVVWIAAGAAAAVSCRRDDVNLINFTIEIRFLHKILCCLIRS